MSGIRWSWWWYTLDQTKGEKPAYHWCNCKPYHFTFTLRCFLDVWTEGVTRLSPDRPYLWEPSEKAITHWDRSEGTEWHNFKECHPLLVDHVAMTATPYQKPLKDEDFSKTVTCNFHEIPTVIPVWSLTWLRITNGCTGYPLQKTAQAFHEDFLNPVWALGLVYFRHITCSLIRTFIETLTEIHYGIMMQLFFLSSGCNTKLQQGCSESDQFFL